jgi:hypothetical protein
MKTLLYHQHDRKPLEMVVVAENKDGTVDLAYKAGEAAVVSGCQVTKVPTLGAACPGQDVPPAAKKAAKGKKTASDGKSDEAKPEDGDSSEPESDPEPDSGEGEGDGSPPPDN